jgi:RNA polymerase sigma factor (sigma-70 family)
MDDCHYREASGEEITLPSVSAVDAARHSREMVELIPALRAFARTFCHQPSEADDLVQETLVKALANFGQFTPGTKLKSWLFTIMRNAFYTRARRDARERPGAADCVSNHPSREATQEWTIRGTEIEKALSQLPPQQRQVLMLVAVLGVSYEECAEICGCAIGTIKSRLNRARATMLELIGERDAEAALERAAPQLDSSQMMT